ncbi:Firmicute eSAT-6 protein secretion system EssA [Archaeoglobus fulgidus DSM 8774]|uniref:Firmicute eSAT-6 protein secretion system EssA n=1 Tax=Archaeoglobus fulgidus DSM 8774 TaxID=1344584 RepID=A0A075WFM8_ARCFL|nr:halocin C8-like domain-containing protein [Archaeoglobus fulgidus]AIG98577.1 Firmicute eSAT-6 protein secretion system EssA [Archaeoglobus fulgidus DSM 8774]
MLKKVLSLVLVLVMLSSSVVPVMAASDAEKCSCGACEITLKRVVEVELAKNGKTILNVTEINQSLSEWFAENFEGSFSCADGSCLAFDYQLEIKELLNLSKNNKELKLLEIKVYNETTSHEFKLLSYFAQTATYNLSLITRIMEIDGENYFVTTINVAPKDDKKFAPFADIVEIKSKTTLAEHYRILAEVLNQIRKGDETGWVWNKAKNELSYLSRVVEREMGEYNVEGYAAATTMDIDACGACKVLFEVACAVGCGVGMATLCILAGLTTGVGGIACAAIAAAVCWAIGEYGCDSGAGYVCTQIGYC